MTHLHTRVVAVGLAALMLSAGAAAPVAAADSPFGDLWSDDDDTDDAEDPH